MSFTFSVSCFRWLRFPKTINISSLLVSKIDDAVNACFGSDDEDKDYDYDWNDFDKKNSAGHD